MDLHITLNTEQTAALNELVETYNLTSDVKATSVDYLQLVLTNIINDKVNQKFNASASQLVEAARKLPYEARLALISQVESTVG